LQRNKKRLAGNRGKALVEMVAKGSIELPKRVVQIPAVQGGRL